MRGVLRTVTVVISFTQLFYVGTHNVTEKNYISSPVQFPRDGVSLWIVIKNDESIVVNNGTQERHKRDGVGKMPCFLVSMPLFRSLCKSREDI